MITDKNDNKDEGTSPGTNKPGSLPSDADKKKEDYLKHPGKIEDYPEQDEVPGTSIAPDNDKKPTNS